MEKSFHLVMTSDRTDRVRAELHTGTANGETRIQISMWLPNCQSARPLAEVQAEVLRLAIADLEREREAHLSQLPPPGATASP